MKIELNQTMYDSDEFTIDNTLKEHRTQIF